MEEDDIVVDKNRKLVGVMVSKGSDKGGLYTFKYDGHDIDISSNILYVVTDIELTDKELKKRFLGTKSIKEIIR